MILNIVQNSKDLFYASFVIKHGSVEIGHFFLQGKFGSMEARISGIINGESFEMAYGKTDRLKFGKLFRPYVISELDKVNGVVYQTQSKDSWLKRFNYHQMKIQDNIYDLFPIGFGNDGSKNPIYNGNEQIAQIEKECIVYNELHKYRIYAKDIYAAQISIFFCIYMYINAAYRPGEKVVLSKTKMVSKTTNKLLLEKYDPLFIKNISE